MCSQTLTPFHQCNSPSQHPRINNLHFPGKEVAKLCSESSLQYSEFAGECLGEGSNIWNFSNDNQGIKEDFRQASSLKHF